MLGKINSPYLDYCTSISYKCWSTVKCISSGFEISLLESKTYLSTGKEKKPAFLKEVCHEILKNHFFTFQESTCIKGPIINRYKYLRIICGFRRSVFEICLGTSWLAGHHGFRLRNGQDTAESDSAVGMDIAELDFEEGRTSQNRLTHRGVINIVVLWPL